RQADDRAENLLDRLLFEPRPLAPRAPRREHLRLARRVEHGGAELRLRLRGALRELCTTREEEHDIPIERVDVLARLLELGRTGAEVGDREARRVRRRVLPL